MARLPFKESMANSLNSLYIDMSKNADLRADLHGILMTIDDSDEFEKSEINALKYVLQQTIDIYHICDRDVEEFNTMISFLKPSKKE